MAGSVAGKRVWRGTVVALLGLALGELGVSGCADRVRQDLAGIRAWAVVYARDVAPGKLKPFDLVVVDADVVASPGHLKRSGAKVLAYLSLGEVHQSRPYFSQVRAAGWLVRENPNWKGSFLVDVRHEGWQRMVVDRLVPGILDRGFDGLFLDTLDTAETLEREEREKYSGSIHAMVGLVKAARAASPKALLLPNNAFRVLAEIAPIVDGIVAESVFATYDFSARRYVRVAEGARLEKLAVLTEIRRRHRVPIFTIEYAAPQDEDLRAYAHEASRAAGFVPYIATIDLQEVHAPLP